MSPLLSLPPVRCSFDVKGHRVRGQDIQALIPSYLTS